MDEQAARARIGTASGGMKNDAGEVAMGIGILSRPTRGCEGAGRMEVDVRGRNPDAFGFGRAAVIRAANSVMVVRISPLATTGCEPRQARKGATVATASGAGVWRVRATSLPVSLSGGAECPEATATAPSMGEA